MVFEVVQGSLKPTAGRLHVEILEAPQVFVPFGTHAHAPPIQVNFVPAFHAPYALEETRIVYQLKFVPTPERYCLGVWKAQGEKALSLLDCFGVGNETKF